MPVRTDPRTVKNATDAMHAAPMNPVANSAARQHRSRCNASVRGSSPCAAAPNAAPIAVAKQPSDRNTADATPSPAAGYASRTPSTNATPATRTFVRTVVGSITPPHRGSETSGSVVIGQERAEECKVVPVPFALKRLVRVVPALEAQKLR